MWILFSFRNLLQTGYAVYSTGSVELVFTLRGNSLIDVFDLNANKQIAYLDFDTSKPVMLGSAFRSPLIGLPFSPRFRKRYETDLLPLKDQRSLHEVGFFVGIDYRNKGKKGIWNLDELMMAIAFETAFEKHIEDFTIKPTGDTKRYYRKKFHAEIGHDSKADSIMIVHLKTVRNMLQHIHWVEKEGKTEFFRVKVRPDLMT